MEIKTDTNPVGEVKQSAVIDQFIESMKALWESTRTKPAWWKFWQRMSPVPVTNFLLKCLDDLIAYVDQIVDTSGADKKATVLNAIGKIYDYIAIEALPLWAKPFSTAIRSYIIDTMISSAIDYIVEKYRHGSWRPKPVEEIQAQWVQLHAQLFGVPGGHRPKI